MEEKKAEERVKLDAEVLPITAEVLRRMAETFDLSVGELLDHYAKNVGNSFGGSALESQKEAILIQLADVLDSDAYR